MLLMNKFHKSTTPALLGSSRPSWVLPCPGQRASIAWGQTHLFTSEVRPILFSLSDPSSDWGQTHLLFTFVAKVSCFTSILLIGPGKGENPGNIRWALDGVGEFGTYWAVEYWKVESVTSVWSLQLGGEHQHHANIFRRFWASFWQAVTPRPYCVDKYIDRIIQRAITKIEQCTNTGDGSCFFSEIVFSCIHERRKNLPNHLPNLDSRQHHFLLKLFVFATLWSWEIALNLNKPSQLVLRFIASFSVQSRRRDLYGASPFHWSDIETKQARKIESDLVSRFVEPAVGLQSKCKCKTNNFSQSEWASRSDNDQSPRLQYKIKLPTPLLSKGKSDINTTQRYMYQKHTISGGEACLFVPHLVWFPRRWH